MNILSVRQLNEIGYKILIKSSVLSIRNAEKRMLAKISCAPNQFYVLDATIIQLVFFLAHGEEDAWWLPARLGHLNFQSLGVHWEQLENHVCSQVIHEVRTNLVQTLNVIHHLYHMRTDWAAFCQLTHKQGFSALAWFIIIPRSP
jgi:hypothetical protein